MGFWQVFQIIATIISVASGVKAYRQAKALERKGQDILIQKYGTGGHIPVIYGTRKVAGTVLMAETVNNKELFVVYALCQGESEWVSGIEISGRSINDRSVFRDGYIFRSGSNFYGSTQSEIDDILGGNPPRMVFNVHRGGSDTNTADPMLVGCVPGWTSDHKLQGITYLACNFHYDSKGMFTQLPEITATVMGKKLYDPRLDSTVANGSGSHRQNDSSTWTHSNNPPLALLDYLTNNSYGKGIAYDKVDLATIQDSANDVVTSQTTTHSAKVVRITQATEEVRFDRTDLPSVATYSKIKIGNQITITDGGSTTYASGIVIDKNNTTRDDTYDQQYRQTSGTEYDDKPHLTITLAPSSVSTEISQGSTTTSVTITEVQKRFEIDAVIDTGQTVLQNVQLMCANMRGIFTYSDGLFGLNIEGAEAVTLSIDEDDILDDGITLQLENKEDKYNKVIVEFDNAQKDYQLDTVVAEHTATTDASDYTSDDGGESLEANIDFPYITNQAIAVQHAESILKRSRNSKTITFRGTHKLLNVKVGELISVTDTALNMNAEQYRVTKMDINADLSINVTAIIYQSDIYGYVTPPGENIDIPGDPIDPYKVDPPTGLNFVSKNTTNGKQPHLVWNTPTTYPSKEFRVIIKDSSANILFDGRTENPFYNLSGILVGTGYVAEVSSINSIGTESIASTYNFNNSTPPVDTPDLVDDSVTNVKIESISADKINTGEVNLGTASGMAVRQAKTGYTDTTTGFWLGNDGGTPKFNIGTSSNHFKFDGSSIDVLGNFQAGSGSTIFKADSQGIYLGNSSFENAPFKVLGSGEVQTTKKFTAGAINSDQVAVVSGGDADYRFWSGNRVPTLSNFSVDKDGKVQARNLRLFLADGVTEFFNAEEGFTDSALSQISTITGTKVDTVSKTSASDSDYLTITLTANTTVNITVDLNTAFGGGSENSNESTAISDSEADIPDNFTIQILSSSDNGASYNVLETQQFTKTTSTPSATQYKITTSSSLLFLPAPFGTIFLATTTTDLGVGCVTNSGNTTLAKNSVSLTGTSTGTSYRIKAIISTTDSSYDTNVNKVTSSATRVINVTDPSGNGFYAGTGTGSQVTPSGDITRVQITTDANSGLTGGLNVVSGDALFDLSLASTIPGEKTFSNNIIFGGNLTLNNNSNYIATRQILARDTNGLSFKTSGGATTMYYTHAGDVTVSNNLNVSGDFSVQGSTTVIDTTNLNVKDKNITLNYASGDTSANANGSGITIQDAVSQGNDATLLWNQTISGFKFSHDLRFDDDIRIELGSSSDLVLYHQASSTTSHIIDNSGTLNIQQSGDDGIIRFQADNGTGGVTTYYSINGLNEVNQFFKPVKLGDSTELRLGSGNDLRIYHDGLYSYIKDLGTGGLYLDTNGDGIYLRGTTGNKNMIKAIKDGAVEVYYNGEKKLETTSTGIDITGTLTTPQIHIDSTAGQLKISRVGSSNNGIYWDRLGNQDAIIYVADSEHLNIDNNFGNPINLRIGAVGSEAQILRVDSNGIDVTGDITATNDIVAGKLSAGGNVDTTPDADLHIRTSNLGNTAGDEQEIARFQTNVTNGSMLRFYTARDTDGSDWTTAYTRIEQRIDASDMAYIQFNGSDNNRGMELGYEGDGKFAKFVRNGASTIYYSNSPKLATASGGVNITGLLTTTSYIESYSTTDGIRTNSGNIFRARAPGVESGKTTAHEINYGWSSTHNRTYNAPKIDGTNDFNKEFGFDFTTLNWYFEDLLTTGALTSSSYITAQGVGTFKGITNLGGGTRSDVIEGREFTWYMTGTGTTDSAWKKIADVTISTGSYKALSMRVIVESQGSNFGNTTLIHKGEYIATYYRSAGTLNDVDTAYLTGFDSDYHQLRIVKTATGVYELQMLQVTNYKDAIVHIKILSTNGGDITLTQNRTTNGSTTGTIYTATQNTTGSFINKYNRLKGTQLTITGHSYFQGGISNDVSGQNLTIDDSLSVTGNTELNGNLTLSYTYPRINLTDTNNDSDYSIINNDGAFGIYDVTNSAYRLYIDSSGNTMIGTTNNSPVGNNVNGIGLFPSGSGQFSRDSGTALLVNRKTDDGELIRLNKDGSAVGSIGTSGGDLIIGTGDTGLYFYDGADRIIPWNISTNSARNGNIDLGNSSHQFKDFYLSGTINTAVGSIGANGGRPYFVNNVDGGIHLATDGYGRALLLPADQNGAPEDNLHHLGSSSYRWRNLYLAGDISAGGSINSGSITSGDITIEDGVTPVLTLSDTGNAGGGGASAKVLFKNTGGDAMGIGYTANVVVDSDMIISNNASGTYGGYLGLDANAITDTKADIVLEPKTNVYVATGNVGVGQQLPTANINSGSYFKPDSNGKFVTINGGANGGFIMLESSTTTSGDQVGGIYFTDVGGQGDAHKQVAGIDSQNVTHSSANLEGGNLRFFTKPAGSGVNVPRLTINDSGTFNFNSNSLYNISGITTGTIGTSGTTNFNLQANSQTVIKIIGVANTPSVEDQYKVTFNELYKFPNIIPAYGSRGGKALRIAQGSDFVNETPVQLEWFDPNLYTSITATGSIRGRASLTIEQDTSPYAGSDVVFNLGDKQISDFQISDHDAIINLLSSNSTLGLQIKRNAGFNNGSIIDSYGTGDFIIETSANAPIIFKTDNTTRLTLDGTGSITATGTTKVQATTGTNRGVELSINGEIAQTSSDASYLHLQRYHDGRVAIGNNSNSFLYVKNNIDAGNINVGVTDTTNGTVTIHGGAPGNAEGGEIRLHTSADHDDTYDFYRLDVINDDFRIGRQGQTDFYIFQDGLVKAENNFEVGGNITSGQINATTSADATAPIIATNTGGVNSIIQRWVGDSDALDVRCINTGDYQISNSQQTNGIDFYDGTGGLAFRYNNQVVAQMDGGGGFNLITGAYKIANQSVITNERKLDNITGFSGSSSVTNGYDFNCNDTVANTSFTGMMIDHNASGSDTLDADRTHRALYIDQDSSATGGDTTDEHRLYGLHLTQDASGDSDLVYGINILSIAKHSSGQVSALRAINSTARTNTSANVSTAIGVAGSGQAQGGGNVTGIYGGFFKGHVLSTNTNNRSNAYGVYAEVEHDSDTTLTNAYAIRSVIDRDAGTITNGYLLHGSYEGTRPTNAYGLYISSDVKNYFAGTVTIGNNNPDKNGLNVQMADAEIVINDTNNTPVLRLRENGTTKSVITTSSGALTLSSGGSAVALTLDTSQNAIFTADVTAFSDARLKDNIQTLNGKKALQMRGVSYMRDGKMGSGVIAQEIEKIAPELVKTANDEQGTKSVAYGNLVGYLIEAIKDQQKQIDELTEKLESVA